MDAGLWQGGIRSIILSTSQEDGGYSRGAVRHAGGEDNCSQEKGGEDFSAKIKVLLTAVLPNIQPYMLITFLLFMIKVLFSFAVDHYGKAFQKR